MSSHERSSGGGRPSERRIRREYPIDDLVPGWFFRADEVSFGVYRVDGTDLSGRTLSRTGFDPDELLRACARAARAIAGEAAPPAQPVRRGLALPAPARLDEAGASVEAALVRRIAPSALCAGVAERVGAPPEAVDRECLELAVQLAAQMPASSLLALRIELVRRLRRRYPVLDPERDLALAELALQESGARELGSRITLPDGTVATVERRAITAAGGVRFTLRTDSGTLREHEFFD